MIGCAAPIVPLDQRPALLVLPLNFDEATPDEMLRGLDILAEAIVDYVHADGSFRCERVDFDEVVAAWPAALHAVGGPNGQSGGFEPELLEAARSVLVRRIAADREIEAVVVPTLVIKEGVFTSKGNQVKWDGVYRRPPMGPGFTVPRQRWAFTGKISVTSIWASLYSRDGRLRASASGGLEVTKRMDFVRRDPKVSETRHYVQWVDRRDLFQDPVKIEKAVELSIAPILAHATDR